MEGSRNSQLPADDLDEASLMLLLEELAAFNNDAQSIPGPPGCQQSGPSSTFTGPTDLTLDLSHPEHDFHSFEAWSAPPPVSLPHFSQEYETMVDTLLDVPGQTNSESRGRQRAPPYPQRPGAGQAWGDQISLLSQRGVPPSGFSEHLSPISGSTLYTAAPAYGSQAAPSGSHTSQAGLQGYEYTSLQDYAGMGPWRGSAGGMSSGNLATAAAFPASSALQAPVLDVASLASSSSYGQGTVFTGSFIPGTIYAGHPPVQPDIVLSDPRAGSTSNDADPESQSAEADLAAGLKRLGEVKKAVETFVPLLREASTLQRKEKAANFLDGLQIPAFEDRKHLVKKILYGDAESVAVDFLRHEQRKSTVKNMALKAVLQEMRLQKKRGADRSFE